MKTHINTLLCDLDGVLTKTAKLHGKTWKILFDEFLKKYAEEKNEIFHEFNLATDYPQYVDGIPRLDGIRSFLNSRSIIIPEGNNQDPINKFTVHSLGKQKNLLFHKLLNEEGVETYSTSIETLKAWKKMGLKMAVVSSSKNCRHVLEVAGITDLFDAIVDGNVRQKKNLKGKPYPDTFLYACELLKSNPYESAVVEDAATGIEAAVRGEFGLSIGIKNENNFNLLKEAKADTIVNNLSELIYTGKSIRFPTDFENIKQFSLNNVNQQYHKFVFFFDYDGTLTQIVSHPEDALLSSPVKERLLKLSTQAYVTIISGRDKEDVKKLVDIENLYYAGCHGLDIEGPHECVKLTDAEKFTSSINAITNDLQVKLKEFEGVQIESKKYSVAVHFRNTAKNIHPQIIQSVEQLVKEHFGLRTVDGKMVIEILPTIDWNKGKAMQWISEKLHLREKGFHHFYIGDDVTDEDAFKALPENGTGILVGNPKIPSYADFRIESSTEIINLLDSFIEISKKRKV